MTSEDSGGPVDSDPIDGATVQLLVADEGNRTAIRSMLSDHFEVLTDHSIVDADAYLVEDRLLGQYREALRRRIEERHPEFCPVVLIRDPSNRSTIEGDVFEATASSGSSSDRSGTPLLVDEFVDAPIDERLLVRRLGSLLVRRQQSRELRRFERAVENTGNAIAITDVDGTIEYVNPPSSLSRTTRRPRWSASRCGRSSVNPPSGLSTRRSGRRCASGATGRAKF